MAALFPAELELSSLLPANGGDGSVGFVLNGIDGFDHSGVSVSAAGDVNGDGTDDLLIGAFQADPGGRNGAGEIYVVFGRDQAAGGFPADLELSSLLPANGGDGSAGFVLSGIDAGDYSGFSVSAAGDVNDDGIDDLIIGAFQADPGGRQGAGESYVVFGQDQAAGGFPAEFELSSLLPANGGDGSAGFVLNGIDGGDTAGISVSAGDVNGDGIDDLLIGATGADPPGEYRDMAGQTYVVFGRDQTAGGFPAEFELSTLLSANGGDGSAGFVLNGIGGYEEDDLSGRSVSTGDVDGDGIDDILVGAPGADTDGVDNDAGQIYVVFGRDQTASGFPAEFELSNLLPGNGGDGSAGFVLNGIGDDYDTGFSVSSGDVNGDGIDDVLTGTFRYGAGYVGQSYVVFGRDQTDFPAELDLSSLRAANGGDGSAGFVLNGIDRYDYSGRYTSVAGDVNGDGIDDLLIGAFAADPDGRISAGESYVVFGQDQTAGGFPAEFELSSLLSANGGDGGAGFVLNGIGAGDYSGRAVSAAGDVNGDGIDDALVAARRADPGGRVDAGQTYVVFGRNLCEGLEATIIGTQGDDDIRGTSGPDVISALKGNDTIRGLGGDDVICGGQGDDVIDGNGGNDVLFGQAGDDTLIGAGGVELLVGGPGSDILKGGGRGDQLFGEEGDDVLNGGGGNDHTDGGAGIDICNGGGGNRDTGADCESSKKIP